jgi:guanylate kinase
LPQKVLIITAPSGAGKSTIVKHLLGVFPQLQFSISATTRSPRGTETHGVEYYFLSVENFKEKIAQEAFLEWEMVYEGKYYGTLKSEVKRINEEDGVPVLDIDVKGATFVKQFYKEEALSIFIKAPSKVILEQRLRLRNTDSEESIQQRLQKAEQEEQFIDNFDQVIVNDDLATACAEASALLNKFLN